MAFQIGLCDDEVYQIKVNGLYLKEIAEKNDMDLEYHGFTNGTQLKKYLDQKQLDILFMDIDLGKESGIELASQLTQQYPKMMISFVTGHREFTQEAYAMDAMGYLVKPYEMKRMETVLRRSVLQVMAMKEEEKQKELVVTYENLKKKIACKDIVYIQRQLNKSVIKTVNKQYSVYETITSLCERAGEDFIRINQSEVINNSFIKNIEGEMVYLTNGMELSIGRTYKKEVREKYFGK